MAIDLSAPRHHGEILTGYGDTRDDCVFHRLPDGLDIHRDASGRPDIALMLYQSLDARFAGGVLQIGLRPRYSPPAIAEEPRPQTCREPAIGWLRGGMRARLPAGPSGETIGSSWRSTVIDGHRVAGLGLHIEAPMAEVLALLARGEPVTKAPLEIEVVLTHGGLRGSWAAAVVFPAARVAAALAARFADGPATAVEIRRTILNHLSADRHVAMTSLGADLQDAAVRQAVEDEVAHRILATAFTGLDPNRPEASGLPAEFRLLPLEQWAALRGLAPDAAQTATIRWDLRERMADEKTWQSRWNLSEIWDELDTQQRTEIITVIHPPGPLEAFPIFVANQIPVDGDQIRRVRARIRRRARDLQWEDDEIDFTPGMPTSRVVWGIQPLGTQPAWFYALQVHFGPPDGGGWPPRPALREADGSALEWLAITPQRMGIALCIAEAQTELFEVADSARVEIRRLPPLPPVSGADGGSPPVAPRNSSTGGAMIHLDRQRPKRWIVLSDASSPSQFEARVFLMPPQPAADGASQPGGAVPGEAVLVRDWSPVPSGRILIGPADAEVHKPDGVRVTLADPPSSQLLLVLVSLAVGWETEGAPHVMTLRPFEPEQTWTVRRPSCFVGLTWRWRAEWILTAENGVQRRVTDWQAGAGERLVLTPPGP